MCSKPLLSSHSHHTSSPLCCIPSLFGMACPKLSLHCSVSVFLAQNPAPARFTARAPQPPQSHYPQHPSTFLHCIPSPFVVARPKLNLCRSVSVFRPQTPASGVSPDGHPNHRDLVIPSTSEPPCIAFHRCLRWRHLPHPIQSPNCPRL